MLNSKFQQQLGYTVGDSRNDPLFAKKGCICGGSFQSRILLKQCQVAITIPALLLYFSSNFQAKCTIIQFFTLVPLIVVPNFLVETKNTQRKQLAFLSNVNLLQLGKFSSSVESINQRNFRRTADDQIYTNLKWQG